MSGSFWPLARWIIYVTIDRMAAPENGSRREEEATVYLLTVARIYSGIVLLSARSRYSPWGRGWYCGRRLLAASWLPRYWARRSALDIREGYTSPDRRLSTLPMTNDVPRRSGRVPEGGSSLINQKKKIPLWSRPRIEPYSGGRGLFAASAGIWNPFRCLQDRLKRQPFVSGYFLVMNPNLCKWKITSFAHPKMGQEWHHYGKKWPLQYGRLVRGSH